ncbi:MAG: gamma-glutamylcyclotransferase [Firmicutes bacterium]|jgi:gamma-glutamylcyclotransferase (GGCT)/AIG2-like uncharacterized protein YtfP|nr:gamma-glutamylcyclotransferase [Bacillota bacterium]
MYYFAYGSNLHKEQMLGRCPDSRPVARVKLHGYQLCFNRVADIVEEEQAVTWGAIYTVSPADIKKLDRYEGYPRLYDKISVVVEDDKGNSHQAFAYVLTVKGLNEPSDGYYHIIKEGYRDWKLPQKPLREALKRSRPSAPVGYSGELWQR